MKEFCEDIVQAKRPYITKDAGYYTKCRELVVRPCYRASLKGHGVFLNNKQCGLPCDDEHGFYYTRSDARKAAYMFRDKCQAYLDKLEK